MTEPDDTDLLAAEYVLGTLDAGDRASVGSRIGRDADLTEAVQNWQQRLEPLGRTIPSVEPPVEILDALMARLFGPDRRLGDGRVVMLRRRVRGWQSATAGFAALAAALALWVGFRPPAVPAVDGRLVAVLQRDAGSPAVVLDVDLASRRLTVRPVSATTPAGRSYQLWIIDPASGSPRSLGLVPSPAGVERSLKPYDDAVISEATYAVTVEPSGGSPSGLPTSAPILSGKLSIIPR